MNGRNGVNRGLNILQTGADKRWFMVIFWRRKTYCNLRGCGDCKERLRNEIYR